ncbi:MAG: AMP-binding protein [Paracoccaceae bacterium]
MNLAEWLLRTAKLRPEAPALLRGLRTEADYATFATRAAGIGGALTARGIAPGERVAIFMANRTEYLEALYGCFWAGVCAVPINVKLHPKEAAWICGDAGARLALISDDPGAPLEAEAGIPCLSVDSPDWARLRAGEGRSRPVPLDGDALAWLFYTSGTTGRPKGVMLSHGNVVAASLCYPLDVDEIREGDCALYAAPASHGAGFYAHVHVRAGQRHCFPESGGFDPGEILELAPALSGVGRDSVSFFAAPTMVRRLTDAARSAGVTGEGIRTIVYGGGPMYVADLLDAIEAMGPRFVQIYGQGEAPMCISSLPRGLVMDRTHPEWRERLASVGVAQSCAEVKIGDEAGRERPLGETGEIMVRGPQVMRGYWGNPEATAATLQDGWLRTGDVGRMDADGFLWLTDRSKDMIVTGGSNVYPREVEEAILEHPDVLEASVIGRASAEWGEEIVAFVAMRPGAAFDPRTLDAWCLERIARFKRPKLWRALPELPKNAYGKILKTELRARLAAEAAMAAESGAG